MVVFRSLLLIRFAEINKLKAPVLAVFVFLAPVYVTECAV